MPRSKLRHLLLAAALAATLPGCATISGVADPRDPYEGFNRAMYQFNDAVDRAVLKPVARGYKAVMPDPLDRAATNFFGNISDLWVLVNDILQLNLEQAASDAGRVIMNSTVGLLGLIDVATPLDMPKHQEDVGQTLGRWGVGPGPYLVLPFVGPSTVRDTVGFAADTLAYDPVWEIDDVATRNPILALRLVDRRADLLGASRIAETAALDEYSFVRDAYLQRREYLVYNGNPPPAQEDEDTGPPPAP
jgi:phospholipid-binding lipoprotein MlaA